MADLTPNYDLILPYQTDIYNVDEFNANYTVIDLNLKQISDISNSALQPQDMAEHNTSPAAHADIRNTMLTFLDGLPAFDNVNHIITSLASNHKSNNSNWLGLPPCSNVVVFLKNTEEIGIFSKGVTLKICNISFRL